MGGCYGTQVDIRVFRAWDMLGSQWLFVEQGLLLSYVKGQWTIQAKFLLQGCK